MYSLILVTAANKKEGAIIAKALLDQKLAACVSMIGGVESLFRWEGRLDKAREALLFIKTRKSLVARVIRKVKTLHSYEVPEIIAVPVAAGNKAYLEWVYASTR